MLRTPIRIGPFQVDRRGQLQLWAASDMASFSFSWRSARCSVRLAEGVLVLRAQVGRVPSTADGRGRRAATLELLRALSRALPAGIGLMLSPDHRVLLETSDKQNWPSSAAGLLAPVVGQLLRMAPVIDLLEETGLNA